MHMYVTSVLVLDDDDFNVGQAGEIGASPLTQEIANARVVIHDEKVLKFAYGPIGKEGNTDATA